MSLVRSLILFISNVAANHACRAPLALPAWARAARGGRRSTVRRLTVAAFTGCSHMAYHAGTNYHLDERQMVPSRPGANSLALGQIWRMIQTTHQNTCQNIYRHGVSQAASDCRQRYMLLSLAAAVIAAKTGEGTACKAAASSGKSLLRSFGI